MASIQQSVNSLFNSALAAAVTGSHAYRQSAMGQRQIAARKQAAELKNINKVLGAYAPGGQISSTATERELQEIESLGKQGTEGTLNYAALTGKVERARAGLETGSRLQSQVDEIRQQRRTTAAQAEAFATMTPSEQAEALAGGAVAEEIINRLRGGK